MDDDMEDEIICELFTAHVHIIWRYLGVTSAGLVELIMPGPGETFKTKILQPGPFMFLMFLVLVASVALQSSSHLIRQWLIRAPYCFGLGSVADSTFRKIGSGFEIATSAENVTWEFNDGIAGVYGMQGRRGNMEDRFSVLQDVDVGGKKMSFFGVYDGHGGQFTAEFVKETLFHNTIDKIRQLRSQMNKPPEKNKSSVGSSSNVNRNNSNRKIGKQGPACEENKEYKAKNGPEKECPVSDSSSNDNAGNMKTEKDTPVKDSPTKDTLTKDTSTKNTPTKDSPTKDSPTKDSPTKNTPTKNTSTKDSPTKDSPTKDSPTKNTPTKNIPTKETPTKNTSKEPQPKNEKAAAGTKKEPETKAEKEQSNMRTGSGVENLTLPSPESSSDDDTPLKKDDTYATVSLMKRNSVSKGSPAGGTSNGVDATSSGTSSSSDPPNIDYIDSYGNLNYTKLLTDQILAVDKQVVQICKSRADMSGTTAVVGVLEGELLVIANVGDSRAVMGDTRGSAIPLSYDHKPNQLKERRRIKEAGGFISFTGVWRVAGVLATSRALGDFPLKEPRPLITAEPDVLTFSLRDHKAQFVILATDGLWDVMSNEEAVSYILPRLSQRDHGASCLAHHAYARGSQDNITVAVLTLGHLAE